MVERGQGRTGRVADSFWGTYLFKGGENYYILIEGGNDSNGNITWLSGSQLQITYLGS